MKNQMALSVLLIIAIILVLSFRASSVYADISDYLNATIKISICGNEIIEGGEDCEKENLNGQTCEGIGYGPGTLNCDIACSFDTYNCSPAPTSTPTPTLTLTPTSSPTMLPPPTTAISADVSTTNSPSPTIITFVTPHGFKAVAVKPILPAFLIPFDPNGDGKINVKEIFVVAKSWVDDWREALRQEINQEESVTSGGKERKCDLNKDEHCDLKDFSILMSYVEK